MRLHELRLHIPHFDEMIDGEKRYDIRKTDDRSFEVGDLINFREWRPVPNMNGGTVGYSGRNALARIVHITKPGAWGLPGNLTVLGIETVEPIWPARKTP
jgi:hypothetical protein